MKKLIKISPVICLYFSLCLYFNYFEVFMVFIVTVLAHELGHLFFIKLFNGEIKGFRLNLFGGIIDYKLKYNNYYQHILISVGRNNI